MGICAEDAAIRSPAYRPIVKKHAIEFAQPIPKECDGLKIFDVSVWFTEVVDDRSADNVRMAAILVEQVHHHSGRRADTDGFAPAIWRRGAAIACEAHNSEGANTRSASATRASAHLESTIGKAPSRAGAFLSAYERISVPHNSVEA